MDEEALAKGLEGKFFWERTTKYDALPSRASLEIRRAQRKWAPKESYYEPSTPTPKAIWWKANRPAADFDDKIRKLRTAIGTHFYIGVNEFSGHAKRACASTAKKFYSWCLCRYFPEVSLAKMSAHIGKHHSTMIYGRDMFEEEKHIHADLIAKMDEYMEYKPG
jgi:hypothetical protein